MSRWYQNVLTGAQVEVTTLEEDDFYAANASNWARITKAPQAEAVAKPAAPMTHATKKAK